MLTLQAVHEAACALQRGNHETPSLKKAIWAAQLSANNSLTRNAKQVEALTPYVEAQPLPRDCEAILRIIKSGDTFAGIKQAMYVSAAEALISSVPHLAIKPTSLEDWYAWRQEVVKTFPGIGYKTASFAALLMWPTDCPLVPVDRHVCARLGVPQSWGGGSYKRYKLVEDMVRGEWNEAGAPLTLGEWHWLKWEQWRQAHNDAPVSDAPQSHQGLCAYEY